MLTPNFQKFPWGAQTPPRKLMLRTLQAVISLTSVPPPFNKIPWFKAFVCFCLFCWWGLLSPADTSLLTQSLSLLLPIYDYHICISLLLLLLQGGLFFIAGLAGICTIIFHVIQRYICCTNSSLPLLLYCWSCRAAVFGITVCSVLQSPLIYYTCCILCAVLLHSYYDKTHHVRVLVMLILVLLSVPSVKITPHNLCMLYAFFYLTWLVSSSIHYNVPSCSGSLGIGGHISSCTVSTVWDVH